MLNNMDTIESQQQFRKSVQELHKALLEYNNNPTAILKARLFEMFYNYNSEYDNLNKQLASSILTEEAGKISKEEYKKILNIFIDSIYKSIPQNTPENKN